MSQSKHYETFRNKITHNSQHSSDSVFTHCRGWINRGETDTLLVRCWTSFNTCHRHLHAITLGVCSYDNLLIISSCRNESMVFNWCFNFNGRASHPRKIRVFRLICDHRTFFRMEHDLSNKAFKDRYFQLNLLLTNFRA